MDENTENTHFKRQRSVEDESDPIQKAPFAGKAIRKKAPIGRRFARTFFGTVGRDVVGHIIHEVLLPALKDMVYEAGTQAIQRSVYGDAKPPARGSRPSGGYHTNYRSYSTTPPSGRDTSRSNRSRDDGRYARRGRDSYDLDDIYFSTKDDADDLIDALENKIDRQGSVSVAQLFDMMGENINPTDENFGWDDLSRARVLRSRERGYDGWKVMLPPPVDME